MAAAGVEAGAAVAEAGVSIGQTIAGIVTGNSEDKNYRSGWTQQTVQQLCEEHPGKNCIVIYTAHDASKLVNLKTYVLVCEVPNNGTKMAYGALVFDSGLFVLQGDGGYLNWALMGNFKRDGNNVSSIIQP
jgi:hypothetical protein